MNIRSIKAPNPGPFTLDGTQTYLLDESVVIDPGPLIESHIAAIAAAMPRLRIILITHRHADHAPAAVPLQAATGAKILAPTGVLEEAQVARRLRGGERIESEGVTLEVIPTPGHTSEHLCFLSPEGDLFAGDTILGTGTTAVFPPDGNMADYMRSLERLRDCNPRRIFPGHGPTREDALPLLDEYIAHRQQRERQVLEALAQGGATLKQMRELIYPDLDPRLHAAAEGQIAAHLDKLVQEGKARNPNAR